MSEEMQMPQPTAEHNALREHAGTWNVHCTFYMDPSQPPMEVEARETVEMFGDFWTKSTFEADMFGKPFKGSATLGYDPHKKEYVSTWVDNMSPALFSLTGNFEDDVLVKRGRAFDCNMQMEANFRTTEKHESPNKRVFEMFVEVPDGSEMKVFTHVYTRA